MLTPALLTAVDSASHIHLIVGATSIASARVSRCLEVGATPILIAPEPDDESPTSLHPGLARHIESGALKWLRRDFQDADLTSLGRDDVDGVVDAVFVTLGRSSESSAHIAARCRRLRIPVNVTDAPELCSFTLLSTFTDGPLQIGVTTSGNGCKLASRIKRFVAASLPRGLGGGVARLGGARRQLIERNKADLAAQSGAGDSRPNDVHMEASGHISTVDDRNPSNNSNTSRLHWLSQIAEFWPLSRLATLTDTEISDILTQLPPIAPFSPSNLEPPVAARGKGRLILVGTGPGDPSLLTLAALASIRRADLILADKLIPSPILDLIPRRTPLHIARKFPGNADAAQDELLRLAHAGVDRGEVVVRLKQGDPFVFGRGGEEVASFEQTAPEASANAGSNHYPSPAPTESGNEKHISGAVTVIPGLSSALTALLCADIPATHRGTADSILITTGTGRLGAVPAPPAYNPTQTLVYLMSLHRLSALVDRLLGVDAPTDTASEHDHRRLAWPRDTPCTIIERASCPDQRIIRCRLGSVAQAFECEGSRPPGLLVVGWACGVLRGEGGRGSTGTGAVVEKDKGEWVVEEGFAGFGVGVEDGLSCLLSSGFADRMAVENGGAEKEAVLVPA